MIGSVAIKNIIHKPLGALLSILLLGFSVGIITLLMLMQQQLDDKFTNDLKDIDVVLGAKGSPLQLVLSAVYHLDAPTGNIPYADAQRLMRNPMIEQAIPLAYGDGFAGFKILGTTADYIDKYGGTLAQGTLFTKNMEAVLGSTVAAKSGLKIGDSFVGSHGEVEGMEHDEHPYTVVGILNATNSVLDQLVVTNVESVWEVHGSHGDHDHGGHDHGDHDHDHADHDHAGHDHHDHEHENGAAHDDDFENEALGGADAFPEDAEITALLLKFKNTMAKLNYPRMVQANTNFQAANPSYEISRLMDLIGVGAATLRLIAIGIMVISGLSVFFILYSRLRDRKHELALLRAMGYRPISLFVLLLIEGVLLAILGYVFGFLLSRAGIWLLNQDAASDLKFEFAMTPIAPELVLFAVTLLVGMLAAIIPAIKAMRIDVAKELS